jgi:hypothetical protein
LCIRFHSQGKSVANKPIWHNLSEVVKLHAEVYWLWVKAHSRILPNECAGMLETKGVNNEKQPNERPHVLVPNDEDSDTSTYVIRPVEEMLDSHWDDMDSIPPSACAWRGEIRGAPAPESPRPLTLGQFVDQNHPDNS